MENNQFNTSMTLMAERERLHAERRLLGELRRDWRRRRRQAKASIYLLAVLVAVPLAFAAVNRVPAQPVDSARLTGASRTTAVTMIDNILTII